MCRLVVLVGLPGAGKSTYLARLGVSPISSDEVRRLLADDPTDQSIHRRVFAMMRHLAKQRIALRRPVTYIDATHITAWERRPYIRIAQMHNCEVDALFFDTPLEVCLDRNRRRGRVVPEAAVIDMAARLVAPSVEEGFARVTVIGRESGAST